MRLILPIRQRRIVPDNETETIPHGLRWTVPLRKLRQPIQPRQRWFPPDNETDTLATTLRFNVPLRVIRQPIRTPPRLFIDEPEPTPDVFEMLRAVRPLRPIRQPLRPKPPAIAEDVLVSATPDVWPTLRWTVPLRRIALPKHIAQQMLNPRQLADLLFVSTNAANLGIQPGTAWVPNPNVAINIEAYRIAFGDEVELSVTDAGTSGDASDLTVILLVVME